MLFVQEFRMFLIGHLRVAADVSPRQFSSPGPEYNKCFKGKYLRRLDVAATRGSRGCQSPNLSLLAPRA